MTAMNPHKNANIPIPLMEVRPDLYAEFIKLIHKSSFDLSGGSFRRRENFGKIIQKLINQARLRDLYKIDTIILKPHI